MTVSRDSIVRTSLFETFLIKCCSASELSLLVWMHFSPNYLITMTVYIDITSDVFQIKTSRQTTTSVTRPYHHLSIYSQTKYTIPPFRLTAPTHSFSKFQSHRVHKTSTFQNRTCEKIKSVITETRIIQFAPGTNLTGTLFVPQRPQNSNEYFFPFFLLYWCSTNIKNATIQNKKFKPFFVPDPSPDRCASHTSSLFYSCPG